MYLELSHLKKRFGEKEVVQDLSLSLERGELLCILGSSGCGKTTTLNMIGGTAKAERNLHIIGTKGEIKGVFDDSVFTVRTIDTASESGWREEVVDLAIGGDKSGMTGSHGGGDLRLVEDFVRVLQGEQPSISCTNINDSLNGHLAVFQAEKARKTGTVCTMPQI